MTLVLICFYILVLHSLLARQLLFSINSTSAVLGTLTPFDWGTIEAQELKTPPNGARNLVLVSQTKESSLFVDGEKPYVSESECPQTANSRTCPTNCPISERGANGPFISRQRRALLCLNDTSSTQTLRFTCSVPCPAWKPASPRIIWLKNGTVLTEENTTIISSSCGSKTIDSFTIATNYYTETIALNISSSNWVTQIECRAYVNEIPEVPCCDNSNDNSLCQPDTGIARVIIHIMDLSNLAVNTLCKGGVDLNSVLPLNEECPLNGHPKYCSLNSRNANLKPSFTTTVTGDGGLAIILLVALSSIAIVILIVVGLIIFAIICKNKIKQKKSDSANQECGIPLVTATNLDEPTQPKSNDTPIQSDSSNILPQNKIEFNAQLHQQPGTDIPNAKLPDSVELSGEQSTEIGALKEQESDIQPNLPKAISRFNEPQALKEDRKLKTQSQYPAKNPLRDSPPRLGELNRHNPSSNHPEIAAPPDQSNVTYNPQPSGLEVVNKPGPQPQSTKSEPTVPPTQAEGSEYGIFDALYSLL